MFQGFYILTKVTDNSTVTLGNSLESEIHMSFAMTKEQKLLCIKYSFPRYLKLASSWKSVAWLVALLHPSNLFVSILMVNSLPKSKFESDA